MFHMGSLQRDHSVTTFNPRSLKPDEYAERAASRLLEKGYDESTSRRALVLAMVYTGKSSEESAGLRDQILSIVRAQTGIKATPPEAGVERHLESN
jgi:hypothetical protein